jgi:hypothetical protein
MPRGLKWIEGEVFGKLTAWQHVGSGPRGALWHCQCECGNLRVVTGSDLRNGRVTDCGHCHEEGERLSGSIQELQAPCDRDCHFRGQCMTYKLACWPFGQWVSYAESHRPDPESYPPNRKIYDRIFNDDD